MGAPIGTFDAATKKYVDDGLVLKSNQTDFLAVESRVAVAEG